MKKTDQVQQYGKMLEDHLRDVVKKPKLELDFEWAVDETEMQATVFPAGRPENDKDEKPSSIIRETKWWSGVGHSRSRLREFRRKLETELA